MLSSKSRFNNLFIVSKSENAIAYDNLLSELSSNNICTVSIRLHLSYAYSTQVDQYSLKTRIINKDRISLNDILIGLSQFILLDSYSISYANNPNSEIYFHCGTYPLKQTVLCELTQSNELWVKLRQNTNESIMPGFSNLIEVYGDENETEAIDSIDSNNSIETKCDFHCNSKRAKERNIRNIIKKLYLWKRIYHGLCDKNGRKVRLTWKEAAELTKISHKSLDDYYNQIKYAKYLGFDFSKHKNEKIGVLRGFVKAHLKQLDPVMRQKLKCGLFLKEIKDGREGTRTNETESESDYNSDVDDDNNYRSIKDGINIDKANKLIFDNKCSVPSFDDNINGFSFRIVD